MTRVWEQGDGANYGFAQAVGNTVPDVPPRLTLSLTLARPQGWDTLVANKVVLDMEVGNEAARTNPLPVEWLLSIGVDLVRDFVDVWRPDTVSLDSMELLQIPSRIAPKMAYPTIGYVSWLSESVADPSTLPPAPIRESYKGGTILGISPDSPHPVEDATQLAESVYTSNILNIIPFIQGQPNPE